MGDLKKDISCTLKKAIFHGVQSRKKKSYTAVCQEKDSFTTGLGKYSYPNQITHTPLQKSNGRPLDSLHSP